MPPARGRPARGGRRSDSSKRWLDRRNRDPWVQRARTEGYRSRAAYKLIQIDSLNALIRRGMHVVDLGAAPGGWTQVAAARGARVVALDLQAIAPIEGALLMEGDFLDADVHERLRAALDGPVDLVLSDMAAPSTGQRDVDRLRAEAIGEAVLAFADEVLAPKGDCLIKLLKGAEARVVAEARRRFGRVRLIRPEATQKGSSEIYMLARGFRRPGPD